MKAFFANVTKAGTFKWELDVAANRMGKPFVSDESRRQGFADHAVFEMDQGMQPLDVSILD